MNYPVTVKLLKGEGWYEGADHYKQWATNQFWCRRGPLADTEDDDKPRWLLEESGLSTFGINAGKDRAKWIRKYHEYIDTSMFHILGPDWPNETQDFCNSIPGGISDWFPTRFDEDTIKEIESCGDKYAPFEFDYLFNVNGSDGQYGQKALQSIPTPAKSIDKYRFPFVCPVVPYVQSLHVERDKQLLVERNVDASIMIFPRIIL